MLDIYVCVGSSCHIRGSESVVRQLRDLIEERGIDADVSLRGSFCLERCSEGVTVRVGETVIPGVLPETLAERVLPAIQRLAARGSRGPEAEG